jgi:hypothetical protein
MDSQKRYQWSMFSPNREEQFVVRSDNWEEIIEGMGLWKDIMPKKPFPNDTGSHAVSEDEGQEEAPVCPKHNKEMTKGQWGWYCRTKDPSTPKGWCTYRPK